MAFLEYTPRYTLYHYTSQRAFESIIKNRALWLTDIKKCNDPRELDLGYERSIDAIKRVRHSVDFIGRRGFFLSVLAGRLTGLIDKIGLYGVCFTPLPDSLPLWRAYGGNGSGLAVGFRPRAIIDMPGRIPKVRYASSQIGSELENFICISASRVERKDLADFSHEDWMHLTIDLFCASTSLKHESWAYEKEVRLLFASSVAASDPDGGSIPVYVHRDGTELKRSDPKSFQGRLGETNYFDFSFGKHSNGAYDHSRSIEKVIVGANCNLSIERIEAMLSESDYLDFSVIKSDCVFR